MVNLRPVNALADGAGVAVTIKRGESNFSPASVIGSGRAAAPKGGSLAGVVVALSLLAAGVIAGDFAVGFEGGELRAADHAGTSLLAAIAPSGREVAGGIAEARRRRV